MKAANFTYIPALWEFLIGLIISYTLNTLDCILSNVLSDDNGVTVAFYATL